MTTETTACSGSADNQPQNSITVCVSPDDFSVDSLYQQLTCDDTGCGGIAMFCGKVRDFNQDSAICGLSLEHYPGMTEAALQQLAQEAHQRWPLRRTQIHHRVGDMHPGDNIVFVGVTSAHRQAAFDACQFMMDQLKSRAPFWKKELVRDGSSHWVAPRQSDRDALKRW